MKVVFTHSTEMDFFQGVGTPNFIEKEIRFCKDGKSWFGRANKCSEKNTHKILMYQGTMFYFSNRQRVLKIISRLGEVNKIFS